MNSNDKQPNRLSRLRLLTIFVELAFDAVRFLLTVDILALIIAVCLFPFLGGGAKFGIEGGWTFVALLILIFPLYHLRGYLRDCNQVEPGVTSENDAGHPSSRA